MKERRKTLVLVIDNSQLTRSELRATLVSEGFDVLEASNAHEAVRIMMMHPVDLVTLDLELSGEDGLSFGRDLRANSDVPIIIITAKCDDVDRIVGLEIGADDYIAKPFNPREVLARLRAVSRRSQRRELLTAKNAETFYIFAGWELHPLSRQLVRSDNHEINPALTSAEFNLLCVFVEHPQRVLSRNAILDRLGSADTASYDRSIDTLIGRLRKKMEPDASLPKLIKTVRGNGYMLSVPVSRSK